MQVDQPIQSNKATNNDNNTNEVVISNTNNINSNNQVKRIIKKSN
jgi:hypothetical protein